MKLKHFSLITLVIALIGTSACKKSNSTDTTTTNLLTSASWKLTKVEWQTTSGVWVDESKNSVFYMPVQALAVTFFDNGTYTTDNSHQTGTWTLSSDKTTLTFFTSNATSPSVTVTALTAATLQMTTPLTNVYTITYNPYVMTTYSTERDTYTH